jgi:hypothetical protein
MIMSVEQTVEFLAGETEILGENLPQCSVVYHKSHIISLSSIIEIYKRQS